MLNECGQKVRGPQGESIVSFGETHTQAYDKRMEHLRSANKHVYAPAKSVVEIAIEDGLVIYYALDGFDIDTHYLYLEF